MTQPSPQPLDPTSPSMHDLAIRRMEERRQIGLDTYGKPLQAFNRRRMLDDALDEVADLLVYLEGEREERRQFAKMVEALYHDSLNSKYVATQIAELRKMVVQSGWLQPFKIAP